MSTNAIIIVKCRDGYHRSIYVHGDGYESHTGRLLRENYNSQEAAEAIIALGNLSFLGETLYPTPDSGHSFETPERGVTIAYGRDRGEYGQHAKLAANLKNVESGFRYTYYWTGSEWRRV